MQMKRIIAVLLVVFMLFIVGCEPKPDETVQDDNPVGTVDDDTDDTDDPGEDEDIVDNSDDLFTDYVVKMARDMAEDGNLLQDTTGDVSAHKMTVDEIDANAEQYRTIIKDNIGNVEVVVDIHTENGMKYYEFKIEASLNILGLGTHMGIGFPDYLEIASVDEMGYWLTAIFSCPVSG